MNDFNQLGLSEKTLKVLSQIGFEKPTPVQEKAIPLLLGNNPTDFIGLAQTGTGKTAAFGLPLVDLIDMDDKSTQALIMAPTRELGQQTAQQLTSFAGEHKGLNVVVVYGGANISMQIQALRKPSQIIVATPGRLLDLIKRKAVRLDRIKYVVLDEADEMLNMGFKEAIDEILEYTPKERVTWLFSATMPSDIRKIVRKYMENPLEVSINQEEKVNKDISHQYVVTKSSHKVMALRRFLDQQPEMRGILFCRTKRETQEIADDLSNQSYGVEALHGDLSQAQRDAVMKRFKRRSMQLLIATDVAARGIDVNDLTHVFHHKLPDQLEAYTHRSGRTARAGKKGISLAFVSPSEERRISELERKIKTSFVKVEIPSLDELKSSRIQSWANLIINTKVDDKAENILENLHHQFAHLSKEDILKRLITSQLDHLLAQNPESANLNANSDGNERGKSSKKGGGRENRYFVNIGLIDGVTKGDLIHFLSDIGNINREHIQEVSMQKNCAFFNVMSPSDKGLSKRFDGIEIEGRSIRVNKDDQGPSQQKGRKTKRNFQPDRKRSRKK